MDRPMSDGIRTVIQGLIVPRRLHQMGNVGHPLPLC